MTISTPRSLSIVIAAASCLCLQPPSWADTQKPVLHGKQWVAVTGKPLAATAGALTFARGGNAVDAASIDGGAVYIPTPVPGPGTSRWARLFERYCRARRRRYSLNGSGPRSRGSRVAHSGRSERYSDSDQAGVSRNR